MTAPETRPEAAPATRALPEVLVVGAASRDIVEDDPRGWRLGGGVSYSALAVARLGLPTRAIIGVDAEASGASELDLLRDAGVDLRLVRLDHGPIFVNIERPEGRLQLCHSPSDPIPVDAIPEAWRSGAGWLLVPVAGELPAAWAAAPPSEALVAVGWQGLLRDLAAGEPVRHLRPRGDPLVARADLAGLSRDDVDRAIEMDQLIAFLRPGGTLVVTQGDRGGLVAKRDADRPRLRHYPAVPSRSPVDPTGAGDVFLASLAAARIEPRLVGGRIAAGYDLLMAAAAASLVLEGPGLHGVPDRDAVRRRMAEATAGWAVAGDTAAGDEPRGATGAKAADPAAAGSRGEAVSETPGPSPRAPGG
jgi:sugar/nucleoside kinase (ribokinase family)